VVCGVSSPSRRSNPNSERVGSYGGGKPLHVGLLGCREFALHNVPMTTARYFGVGPDGKSSQFHAWPLV
jgi:hypothetical protein